MATYVPTIYVDATNGLDTNDGSSALLAFKTVGAAMLAAGNNDVIFFAAGDYTGTPIDIPTGKQLTFVSANAGTDPDLWSDGEVVLDRIISQSSVTVDGIHIHATIGGDGDTTSSNGPYWQGIGTGFTGLSVTVKNSLIDGEASGVINPDFDQPFGLNLQDGAASIVVDHVHFGPFTGLNPAETAYGMYINHTSPSATVTITDNVFETGAPKNTAIGFDSQEDSADITVTGNSFEDPGVAPAAIRFFDWGGLLTDPQEFDGISDNTMTGDGSIVSNETGTVDVVVNSDDVITGTSANETFVADGGNDAVDGAGGIDTYDMTAAGTGGSFVDLNAGLAHSSNTGIDTLANIENAKGSAGNDGLYGTATANTFYATAGSDIIDGRGANDGDTFDASDAGAAVTANLATGTVTGAYTASLTSIENIKTGSNKDTITLSSAANVVDGGGDTDTAVAGRSYTGAPAIGWDNTAQAFTYGDDTLKNVEKLAFDGGKTVWLVHDETELTSALAGAVDGDVIKLAKNTYTGNFTISDAITIESATGVAGDAVIKGNFRSNNGMGANDSVAEYMKTHNDAGVSSLTGNGLTIGHSGVTLKNITVSEYNVGVALVADADGVTLDHVDFTSNMNAMRKSEVADITHFTWTGGTVKDGWGGLTVYAHTNGDGDGGLDNVVIDGVKFQDLTYKGLYFEQLSTAEIKNITMNNVGEWGAWNNGKFGAGIDINLKYEAYTGINIHDFTFTDVGSSTWGDAVADPTGAAIVVKARSDSGYASHPATLNDVQIHDGTIDGTSTGIRFGEPGANNVGPGTVTVSGVTITDALLGSYDNQSLTPRIIQLTANADTVTTSATSITSIIYQGGDGADSMTGSSASEGFEGGAGNDTVDGGAGIDAVGYAGMKDDAEFGFVSGKFTIKTSATDTDTVSNVEQAVFANGTPLNAADDTKVLFVGNGGYSTITAALAAASDDDTIVVGPGTWSENVVVNKSVTIIGAGASTIVKSVTPGSGSVFTIAADGVTIKDMSLQNALYGVNLDTSHEDVTLDGLSISGMTDGIKVGSSAHFDGLNVSDTTLSNNKYGMYIANDDNDTGGLTNVDFDTVTFANNLNAAIYGETLSNATFTNITATDNATGTENGVVFDFWSMYNNTTFSNITFDGFVIDNTGVDPAKAAFRFSTYANATDASGITLTDGSIVNVTRALHTSEPASAFNVNGVTVTGLAGTFTWTGGPVLGPMTSIIAGDYGDSTLTGDRLSVVDNDLIFGDYYDTTNGFLSGVPGNDSLSGGGGNDTIFGGGGTDTVTGGAGNDVLDGGESSGDNDVAVFELSINNYTVAYNSTLDTYTVTQVGGGQIDTAKGFETLRFGGTDYVVSSNQNSVVNDDNPVFNTPGDVVAAINENVVDAFVTNAGATDADNNSIFGGVTYTLEGVDKDHFNVDTSGVVTFDGSADRETASSYNFSVRATQGVTSSVKNVSVTVNDLNDNDPVFNTSGDVVTSINENVTNAAVANAGATDADATLGALIYTLEGTDKDFFNVDSNGLVTFDGAADHETQASFSFAVRATQGASSSVKNISVSVNDANDNNPAFNTPGDVVTTINENVANVVVTNAGATDADATFGSIVYTLEGADKSFFNVNSSGVVTFNGSADRETDSSYNFSVRATQGVTSSVKNVAVTVNDANDNNPVFQSGTTASVDENAATSTIIYDAAATDADLTLGAITYTLGGTDGALFNVDAGTGVVRLNNSANFEAKASYSFSVIATQGSSSTAQGITLTVNDKDEGITGVDTDVNLAIEKGTTKAPLGELAAAGTTFDIVDLNAGGGKIYNGSTLLAEGQEGLTLAEINALTFSSKNTASIQLLAHDGINTEVINVTIAVTAGVSKTYSGTNGADHIDGANRSDTIIGRKGADVLVGGSGRDSIEGGKGADTISGGKGHDSLMGGAGADKFVFDAAATASTSDVIQDFVHGTDKIVLESDFFAALGGSVGGGEFRMNTTGDAKDHNDKLIYNSSTGELFYDADGSRAGAKVLVATLDPHISNLSHLDFEIV